MKRFFLAAAVVMLNAMLLNGTALGETVVSQSASAAPPDTPQAAPADLHPRVLIETTQGNIVVELDRSRAPISVANFLTYVEEDHYDGTVFHRVIDGFMIQGGGFTTDFERKPPKDAIQNEADNGLHNTAGTIAMARTSAPHSATAQFFINVNDNAFLDFKSKRPGGWGYTVFGRVVEGMDTVDRIRALPTGRAGRFQKDFPQPAVVITRAVLISAKPASAEPVSAKPAADKEATTDDPSGSIDNPDVNNPADSSTGNAS